MRKVFLFIIFVIFTNLCIYSESQFSISFFDNAEYKQIQKKDYWTYEMQEVGYQYFFLKKDFEGIFKFYEFNKQWYSKEFCNPVIFALKSEKYKESLQKLYDLIPEAFDMPDNTSKGFSEKPIIYAIRFAGVDCVKFFFDKKIPIAMDESLFGSWDVGGNKFPFGFNLLTAIDGNDKNYNNKMQKYLISQGFSKERQVSNVVYYSRNSENIYTKPGYKNKCIGYILSLKKIDVISFTMYKVDGCQWAKINYEDNKIGWIPVTYLSHMWEGHGI